MKSEQEYVTTLFDRLDQLREQAEQRLAAVRRHTGGTYAARTEREAEIALHTTQLAQLRAVEQGLCFGRLDFADGERRYIGRIGIFDEADDYHPLLVDWRAPAARPFYVATAAAPHGVVRRRHIQLLGRTVTGVHDEYLDLTSPEATETASEELDSAIASEGLIGEAALLAALNASRTGRMKDIVETIQAEQDRVIRSDLSGVLVVQGGPGTGKTAVALHRAAYLLYTHREQLTRRGVLVLGPNATFLHYIEQVLPSLAESGVLPATLGDLFPGAPARRDEPAATAEVKGRPVMAEVIAAAVADREQVPAQPRKIVTSDTLEGFGFRSETLWLTPQMCVRARDAARALPRSHNQARPVFAEELIGALAAQVAERLGEDPYAGDALGGDDAPGEGALLLDEADTAAIRRELRSDPGVQAALDELWPNLTPQQLLEDLYASGDRLRSAAPQLTDAERALLRREPGGGWTPADVPLLDEAAELLGQDDRAERAAEERRRQEQIAFAQGALDIVSGSGSTDFDVDDESEILSVGDLIDAVQLAERHEHQEVMTVAERAAADRKWAYGNIIVDEAQELSPMAWRLLVRRSPSRSMTVVGDVAQTSDLSGAASWDEVLALRGARVEQLTVNYRTPAEIMQVAAGVLAEINPNLEPPRSVRQAGAAPWSATVAPGSLGSAVADAVTEEIAELGDGRLAVLVPAARAAELGAAVVDAVPGAVAGEDPELRSRVVVLTVRQAKGLEFDTVLVVDPAGMVAESPRGQSDLYVALTRATRRLGVLHCGPPPAGLA
ncbi:MAG: HelD family protein [Micromonosporaceae bacterium]